MSTAKVHVQTDRQTDRRKYFLLVLSSKAYKTWTFVKRREFFFHSCDYNTFSFYILRMWWESTNWIPIPWNSSRLFCEPWRRDVPSLLLTGAFRKSARWGLTVCQQRELTLALEHTTRGHCWVDSNSTAIYTSGVRYDSAYNVTWWRISASSPVWAHFRHSVLLMMWTSTFYGTAGNLKTCEFYLWF